MMPTLNTSTIMVIVMQNLFQIYCFVTEFTSFVAVMVTVILVIFLSTHPILLCD